MPIWILCVSAFYHDSSVARVSDGQIVATAEEEHFTRNKHDSDFSGNVIANCLQEVGVSLKDLNYIAFYHKPLVKFKCLLETFLYPSTQKFSILHSRHACVAP